MHTILGAGGAIGRPLLKELNQKGVPVRVVSRSASLAGGARDARAADISDRQAVIDAVAGSEVVYLLVGLKYRLGVWQELWPKIMNNVIEACSRANAKLIFFDNVYMYGKVDGPMTEETPFNPCSRKGEVRARIAERLLDEIRAGRLTALIARAADFYGPDARTGVGNVLVFDRYARGQGASLMASDLVEHSYTFTPDAVKALVLLAESDSAWNQTWHLPTAPEPPTGKEFVAMAARAFGVPPRYTVLKPWMLRMVGLFDATVRELPEMLYQSAFPYIFDSTKFTRTFRVDATPYQKGADQTAASYRTGAST
jgi:nucleoside-diphosphate-sugar epimerase